MKVEINSYITFEKDFSWKCIHTPITRNLSEIREINRISLMDFNGQTRYGHVCELINTNGKTLDEQLILPTHVYENLARQLREKKEDITKLSVSPLFVQRHYYSRQEELDEKLKFIRNFFSDFLR